MPIELPACGRQSRLVRLPGADEALDRGVENMTSVATVRPFPPERRMSVC
jgi:hypothetical protein